MIDLHSHVIWGVDDGARTKEDALEMLRAALRSGTTDIVATPHLNAHFAFDPGARDQRIGELAEFADEIPRIHKGCEFHLSVDNFDRLMEDPFRYTVNGNRYLLIECPDHHIGKHADTLVQRILDSDMIPVVAHPERNPVFQRDPARLEAWVDLGCMTQVTSLSITGDFGRSAAAASSRMLERGMVHIVASDAHDPKFRHTCLDGAFALVEARYGTDAAVLLFEENPRCVIEGKPAAVGRTLFDDPAPKWWEFWKSRSDRA